MNPRRWSKEFEQASLTKELRVHLSNLTKLRVSRFDQIQSSLISAIFVFGVLSMILFAIWWTQEQSPNRTGRWIQPDTPVKPLTLVDIDLDESDFDFLTPTVAPQLSKDIVAVPDILSQISFNEIQSEIDGTLSDGTREFGPTGPGGILGKGTPPDQVSEPNRWSVTYENPNLDSYLSMINSLEIELGIVRLNSNQIIRIKQPGHLPLKIHSNREQESQSFYFVNSTSTARRWDRKIAKDNAVETLDSSLVHFYPPALLQQMRAAESKRIKQDGRTISEVKSTEFMAVSIESGFEFQVRDIDYRN